MPRHDRDAPPGRRDRGGRRGSQCKKEKTPESRSLPRQARSTARGRGGGRGEGRKEGGRRRIILVRGGSPGPPRLALEVTGGGHLPGGKNRPQPRSARLGAASAA